MQGRRWQRRPDGTVVRLDPEAERDRASAPGGDGPARAARRRAKLGLALRLGFRDTYDYLGAVLLMSFLWSVAASLSMIGGHAFGALFFGALPGLLPQFFALLAAVAGFVLVCAPLTAGCFRYARNAAARREPEIFDLGWGYRCALGRSLALGAVHAGVGVVLAGDCYFFLSKRQPLWAVVGAVFGYLFVFWYMMALYGWPLLAGQPEDGRPEGLASILKKSGLLALDNFGFTAGLALAALVLSLFLWGTIIGGFILWAGAMAMFLTQGTRDLLRKYDVLPPDPTLDPIAGETHELGGHGRHE